MNTYGEDTNIELAIWDFGERAYAEPNDAGNETPWGLNVNWRAIVDAINELHVGLVMETHAFQPAILNGRPGVWLEDDGTDVTIHFKDIDKMEFGEEEYNLANWNTAFGWGDHSVAGYLTEHQSLDALVPYTGATGDIDLGAHSIKAQTIQTGDTTDEASAALAGTIRYWQSGENSWAEMCMQTGAETYAWVILAHEDWTI